MVSKRNNNRKKTIKTEKPQPKEEANPVNVVEEITKNVVAVLKPDLDNKINLINQSVNQIGESLKNQLVNEIKDIRSQIPKPQPQQTPSIYGIPVEIIARAVMAYISPKPVDNTAMMNTFQQAQIRKGMAEMSFDDWFMKQMKQKMAKEYLNQDIPKEVQKADEEYMKPLRDVGVNAVKREEELKKMHQNSNMQQSSEEKHEL